MRGGHGPAQGGRSAMSAARVPRRRSSEAGGRRGGAG
jgi:hypothetical protein